MAHPDVEALRGARSCLALGAICLGGACGGTVVFDEPGGGGAGGGAAAGSGIGGQGSAVAGTPASAAVVVASSSTGSTCAVEGDECVAAESCCSGRCLDGVCGGVCTEGGQRCDGPDECCSGRCSAGTCDVVACRAGDPPVTLVEQVELLRLALDGEFVYFTTASSGTVSRVPKSGGEVDVIARGAYATGVAVDESAVYWTDREAGLFRTDKLGGGTNLLARAVGSEEGIALDAASVFWATAQPGSGPHQILQVPKGGGDVIVRESTTASLGQIALTSDRLLWLERLGPVVRSQPLGGGPSTTVAQGPEEPVTAGDGIAVDEGFAYFGYPTGQAPELVRAPLGGGPGEVIASVCDGWAITLDEGSLYCSGLGGLFRVPTSGGAPTAIVESPSPTNRRSIAVDATCVYWTDYSQGLLVRAPR